ncbi:MAG: Flp pilus assembly complex ATPase component TadA, partial [Lachnospiraceae bacterium]|nr:Flp pilus assembly complex ATPase component TadA [Lachnospiraceae bacterium]
MPTIQEIMQIACDAGASDVHITVGIPPKMRVNGNLITMDFPKMSPQDTLTITYSIMSDVQREKFEKYGEFDMSFSIPELGRYRVNAYKQRGSAAMALRLVGTQVPSPEVLGVPESVINLYERKRGLILVTGPTGSGKSTTLAAIIDKINNNRAAHVITLEDPIEYLHQHK